MMKYRTRVKYVTALQLTETNLPAIKELLNTKWQGSLLDPATGRLLTVFNNNGTDQQVYGTDWIVRNELGELNVYTDLIFNTKYITKDTPLPEDGTPDDDPEVEVTPPVDPPEEPEIISPVEEPNTPGPEDNIPDEVAPEETPEEVIPEEETEGGE